MKKIIFFIFTQLYICVTFSQLVFPNGFEDIHIEPNNIFESPGSTTTIKYSPYGKNFTPKGDLKVLIICAGLGEPYDNYPIGGWEVGVNTLPDWATQNSTFYGSNDQFLNPSTSSDKLNISRFFYEMSKGNFRLVADVYPKRINVSPVGVTGWSQLNNRVISKMKLEDPNFDWSPYDKRTNNPNYLFDNSLSAPDNKPDFVVIVYRYKWTQDATDLWYTNPPPVTSQGGYAALDGLYGLDYNGYTFDASSGYTHSLGSASMYGLFIHEISHNLFDCPHYTNANGTIGKYFYNILGGWGMMNLSASPMPLGCANGWERWYLGWIDLVCNGINSNIISKSDLPLNNEFILRDNVTTGDVVRIKIPNGTEGPNEYLWLENHNGNSIFDERTWVNFDGCQYNTLPPSVKGLTAYIESIGDDRYNPFSFWGSPYAANGIKPLHSKGNYDYSFGQLQPNSCLLFGNKIYDLNEVTSNPIAGQSRIEGIRLDYNNNGVIPINENANGAGSSFTEYNWVAMRNSVVTYDFLGSDMNFPVGQKLGMDTNPALINRPIYNAGTQNMSSYFLNGISISVISQNANGDIRVKVSYDDVEVKNNLRWCGSIVLPDITNNESPDLILKENIVLSIDKSGTPNRVSKNTFGDFVNPTSFTCNNSYAKMLESSKILVKNNSTFILNSGSKLEINNYANLVVESGSTLQIKAGANVSLVGSAKIVIKSGGYICVESGANINLQDYNSLIVMEEGAIYGANPSLFSSPSCSGSITKTGNGSVIDYSQDVYIQNQTISSNKYIGGKNIFVGNHVTTSQTTGDVLINNGANVIFDCKNIVFDPGFECSFGSTYEVKNH